MAALLSSCITPTRSQPESPVALCARTCTVSANESKAREELLPLKWLHFPKCGTSFGSTVYHFACPGIAPDARPEPRVNGSSVYMASLLTDYPPERWCVGGFLELPVVHKPLRDARQARHTVAMFRQPKQRLLSHWFHASKGMHLSTGAMSSLYPVQGCMTNMLLGRGCYLTVGERPKARPPTKAETLNAVRLVAELGFVGLTEEWTLSICLFHAMFGTPPLAVEFLNVRVGTRSDLKEADGSYREDLLPGYRDPFDEAVYAEAKRVFSMRLAQYGCNQPGHDSAFN